MNLKEMNSEWLKHGQATFDQKLKAIEDFQHMQMEIVKSLSDEEQFQLKRRLENSKPNKLVL